MAALLGTYSGVIIRTDAERMVKNRLPRERLTTLAVDGVVDAAMTVRGSIARRLFVARA